MTYNNPEFAIFDTSSGHWLTGRPILVPPHGVARVRMEMLLGSDLGDAEEEIRDVYEGTVALLHVRTIDGKERGFRICTRSFAGSDKVVWPKHCKYPVYNLVSLNEEGRNTGRRPQKRRPSIHAAANPSKSQR